MTPTDILSVLKPARLASLLPVVVWGTFLLLILASGPPAAEPDALRAWRTLKDLGAGQTALIILGLGVVALLLDPLQLRLLRLLEGDWPAGFGGLTRWLTGRQRARQRRAGGVRPDNQSPPEVVQEAGARETDVARRFPADANTRPTALGNALAAMEDRAGRRYGWDAVVAWPRLYPVLSPDVRAVVDGQRDRLDALARLSVTAAVTAVLSLTLLYASGWWMLLAAVPVVVSRAAYWGSVHTAVAYGQAVQVAFDLHRFDLLRQLHLPLPQTLADERKLADQVSLMWRQGADVTVDYEHPNGSSGPNPERRLPDTADA